MEYFDGFYTPIGRLHVVANEKGIRAVLFPGEWYKGTLTRKAKHPLIIRAKKELKEYFAGKRKKFTLPLDPRGTSFQKKAWRVLRRIPYGTTISYKEEAKRMGNPKAARAAGSANGRNPIPIIVPCHRVVASLGSLGGYAGGLKMKRFLLRRESSHAGAKFFKKR